MRVIGDPFSRRWVAGGGLWVVVPSGPEMDGRMSNVSGPRGELQRSGALPEVPIGDVIVIARDQGDLGELLGMWCVGRSRSVLCEGFPDGLVHSPLEGADTVAHLRLLDRHLNQHALDVPIRRWLLAASLRPSGHPPSRHRGGNCDADIDRVGKLPGRSGPAKQP